MLFISTHTNKNHNNYFIPYFPVVIKQGGKRGKNGKKKKKNQIVGSFLYKFVLKIICIYFNLMQ